MNEKSNNQQKTKILSILNFHVVPANRSSIVQYKTGPQRFGGDGGERDVSGRYQENVRR